jgi:carbonic anhydrase
VFATLALEVKDIVVCGHSHCGAVRALFSPSREDAPHISKWLELARPARCGDEPTPEALRQTEMRSIALQVERLMTFPTVRERVERGDLCLHGWYYVIEEGSVLGLDIATGEFHPLS